MTERLTEQPGVVGRPCAPRPALGDSFRAGEEGRPLEHRAVLSNRRRGNLTHPLSPPSRQRQRRPAPGARFRLRRRPALTGARHAFRARRRCRRLSRDGRARAVAQSSRRARQRITPTIVRTCRFSPTARSTSSSRASCCSTSSRQWRRGSCASCAACWLPAVRSSFSCRPVSASPRIRRCPKSRIVESRTCPTKPTALHSPWRARQPPRCCRERRSRSRSNSPTQARSSGRARRSASFASVTTGSTTRATRCSWETTAARAFQSRSSPATDATFSSPRQHRTRRATTGAKSISRMRASCGSASAAPARCDFLCV